MAMMNEMDLYADDIQSFCAASRVNLTEPEVEELPDEDARRMLLTDEEAIAEEKRLEKFEQGMGAESAELPPEFNGFVTTSQFVDSELLIANVSFTRAFDLESDFNMAIDITNSYKVFLNWGIFENTTDTNTTYIYGSSKASDAQLIYLLEPTMAKWAMGTVSLANLLYFMF